jgi:hypothetical protein
VKLQSGKLPLVEKQVIVVEAAFRSLWERWQYSCLASEKKRSVHCAIASKKEKKREENDNILSRFFVG